MNFFNTSLCLTSPTPSARKFYSSSSSHTDSSSNLVSNGYHCVSTSLVDITYMCYFVSISQCLKNINSF